MTENQLEKMDTTKVPGQVWVLAVQHMPIK